MAIDISDLDIEHKMLLWHNGNLVNIEMILFIY